MNYKTVLTLFSFLVAVQPANAITWELSKDITMVPLETINSNILRYTYKGVDCEVGKPFKNPLKVKKRQWLRTVKCVKNDIEASITIGCEPGEDDGNSFTINELKGLGYVRPYLGCKS